MTSVQCKRRDCGTLRLRCESVNTELYKLDKDDTLVTSTTSRTAKCPKSYYMVGMKCESNFGGSCSSFRLECTKILFRTIAKCGGLTGDGPTPAPTSSRLCRDLTLRSGPWQDVDRNDCNDYATRGWCQKYGGGYRNVYTANEACCACGGGIER